MKTDTPDIVTDTVERLRSDRDGWVAYIQNREVHRAAGPTCLNGTPFIVAAGNLGLRIEANASIPTRLTPGLCGISHFDRETADRVAALRNTIGGGDYGVMRAEDVPQLRIDEIDEMLAFIADRADIATTTSPTA